MGTIEEIDQLIRARYPFLYIITWEEKRAIDELESLASKQGKPFMSGAIRLGSR